MWAKLLDCLQKSFELSNREKEVAALLLSDYSNTQICDRLFISLNTVKTHTRNIYQKTNTANRTEFKNFCRNLWQDAESKQHSPWRTDLDSSENKLGYTI
jgi:DNA-binding CsgD family transcriptional regulator